MWRTPVFISSNLQAQLGRNNNHRTLRCTHVSQSVHLKQKNLPATNAVHNILEITFFLVFDVAVPNLPTQVRQKCILRTLRCTHVNQSVYLKPKHLPPTDAVQTILSRHPCLAVDDSSHPLISVCPPHTPVCRRWRTMPSMAKTLLRTTMAKTKPTPVMAVEWIPVQASRLEFMCDPAHDTLHAQGTGGSQLDRNRRRSGE